MRKLCSKIISIPAQNARIIIYIAIFRVALTGLSHFSNRQPALKLEFFYEKYNGVRYFPM